MLMSQNPHPFRATVCMCYYISAPGRRGNESVNVIYYYALYSTVCNAVSNKKVLRHPGRILVLSLYYSTRTVPKYRVSIISSTVVVYVSVPECCTASPPAKAESVYCTLCDFWIVLGAMPSLA